MNALLRSLLLLLVRALFGARADWRGCAPTPQQRIYFANHTSHLDTLVVLASLPRLVRQRLRPVAARDYWTRTRLHRFIAERCLNALLIERHPGPEDDPVAAMAGVLAAGDSLLIFPEGTRGDGTVIGPLRSGLYRLATRYPAAELVPVYLDNLSRAMPKGSPLIVPLTCTARYGAPLALATNEDKDAFMARARGALLNLAQERVA